MQLPTESSELNIAHTYILTHILVGGECQMGMKTIGEWTARLLFVSIDIIFLVPGSLPLWL